MFGTLMAFFVMLIYFNPPDMTDPINVLVYVVFILLISIILIYTISYIIHQGRLLQDLSRDYLDQSYVVVFETTIPNGNTTGEKILNLAISVFPELIGATYTLTLWPAPLRYKHDYPKTMNYKLNSYLLDLLLETDEGLFIVKGFQDIVVTLNDLNQLSRLINSHFKKKIFRVICVAKEFDQSFFDKELLERQMINLKTKFPIDLLIEEKVGYSVLWIGS
jgi:hypothetical protein